MNLKKARLKVLTAVLLSTLFVVPFKVAASDGHGLGAALGLLFFVAILFSPWACLRFPQMRKQARRATFSLSWRLGIAAALGNVAQGLAYDLLHAGVASTFTQMNVLFVSLLSVLWLGERLRLGLGLGIGLALTGVVLSQWPAIVGHFSWNMGVLWAVLAAFGFSWLDILSRRDSHGVDTVVTNVGRSWVATLLLSLIPGALHQFLDMSLVQTCACALAALLGPGLGRILLISASRDLPAAESALLQQLRPPLAIPLTSVVFGVWPTVWQWWGSGLVAAGVVIPLLVALYQRRSNGPSY